MASIRGSIGEMPIVESEERLKEGVVSSLDVLASPVANKGPKVLADGTYATESVYVSKDPSSPVFDQHLKSSLRGIVDFCVKFQRVHSSW